MKKLYIYLLSLGLIFIGCKKGINDNIKGESTDERLTKALQSIQDTLTSAPYGWKMVVYPQGLVESKQLTSIFSYYMNFGADNQVSMLSDFDESTSAKVNITSYALKALQRPTLLFDSYSYANIPSDPDISKSQSPTGNNGEAWGSDFEFALTDNYAQLTDTIKLEGIYHHSKAYLVKATKAEQEYYNGGNFQKSLFLNNMLSYFKHVTSTGSTTPLFEVTPSLDGSRSIEISYRDGDSIKTIKRDIYYSTGSMHFSAPVNIGTQTLQSIDNIVYDKTTKVATCSVNGKTAIISESIKPLYIEPQMGSYWIEMANKHPNGFISTTGFHSNGIDDGFKVRSWVDNGFLGTGYPFAGYIYLRAQNMGFFLPLVLDADNHKIDLPKGRGLYLITNDRPHPLHPECVQFQEDWFASAMASGFDTMKPSIYNSKAAWTHNSGFYPVLKSDGETWEMVSAENARTWIRFKKIS